MFLRPDTFVIFDRVVSTKPEYKKTWLLHSVREPKIDGRTFTIQNGDGRLVVQSLLPQEQTVQVIEGYTYGGHTFAPTKDRMADTAGKWRIELSPRKSRPRTCSCTS